MLFALVLNRWTVGATQAPEELSPESLGEIARAQLVAVLCAAGLLALALLVRRREPGRGLLRASLVLLFGVSPLLAVELGWAPYFERPSQLFQRDEQLGWRLRPGARAHWLGVPVEINSSGVRGPERPLDKPAGTRRVLFLGDSVVFGFRIEDDRDTLPAQLEHCLRKHGLAQQPVGDSAATTSEPSIEVINAGVGGWSPWQEAAYLRGDGARFEPDVVLVGFVLNDVTEKLGLERFGGEDVGFQLRNSRRAGLGGWLAASSLADLGRELAARFDVGRSARVAAQERELLSVYDLIRAPGDPRVRAAWEATLPNLEAIRDWCAQRDLPLLVVVFPYTIQLYEQPGQDFGAPQQRLARFCRERDIPLVDLRTPLLDAMRGEGLDEYDLYLDAVHPSARGHEVLAAYLCEDLLGRGWLTVH